MKPVVLTKAAEQQGVMVALYPSREVAEALAHPGGEPAEDLHITLAYLGTTDELSDAERLRGLVAGFAGASIPLAGEIAGTGEFTAGEETVTYASPDVPGLGAFRERLVEVLYDGGYLTSMEHGFIPHITLAYDDIDPEVPNLDLAFDRLSLVIAGERQDFGLNGLRKEDDVSSTPEAHFSDDTHMEVTAPLWEDDDKRIVYGVVMQPGITDSQGDLVCVEEIEQAAHRFLAESRKHDVQHAEEQKEVVTVESFIAPTDMDYHGRPVVKGAWVMAVHVPDDEIWRQIRSDELTGFSIGGTAERLAE